MKLWLLKFEDHDYDEYDAHVVQAKDEERVKFLCGIVPNKIHSNEYESNIKFIRHIGDNDETKEEIILSSFNAG